VVINCPDPVVFSEPMVVRYDTTIDGAGVTVLDGDGVTRLLNECGSPAAC